MRTSESFLPSAVGLLLAAACPLAADVATFSGNGTRLSGSLSSIGEDGIIEWVSPFSPAPLKLRSDKLEQVEFPDLEQSPDPAPIQVTLRNGDLLPIQALSRWDESGLVTETPIAGIVTLPRASLASAQFGIVPETVIYSGPRNLREWTTGRGEPGNWRLRGNSLVSTGQSVAACDFDLPRNFVLHFNLEWDTNSPNISCTFADPLAKGGGAQDFYRFNFDSSGIRIARHLKDKARYRTLAQWQRRPSQFPGKMQVEIRVNRDKRQLELLLDGESEGLIIDEMSPLPQASGVTFSCVTQNNGSQTISDIRLVELSATRARHLAEDRGKPELDSLITIDDDRWSGELLSIRSIDGRPHMVFRTTFSESPWEIPEAEISTLFFAESPPPSDAPAKSRFLLEFHGSGKLSVTDCVIEGDLIRATHPLIGLIQIRRDALRLMRSAP